MLVVLHALHVERPAAVVQSVGMSARYRGRPNAAHASRCPGSLRWSTSGHRVALVRHRREGDHSIPGPLEREPVDGLVANAVLPDVEEGGSGMASSGAGPCYRRGAIRWSGAPRVRRRSPGVPYSTTLGAGGVRHAGDGLNHVREHMLRTSRCSTARSMRELNVSSDMSPWWSVFSRTEAGRGVAAVGELMSTVMWSLSGRPPADPCHLPRS